MVHLAASLATNVQINTYQLTNYHNLKHAPMVNELKGTPWDIQPGTSL